MKIFNTLLALLLTVSAFGQTNGTFNNGGGDQLWSNPENWSGDIPPSFDGTAILRNQDAILDVDTTVARLDLATNAMEDRTLSNTDDSVLTLLGTANNYIVMRCRPTDTPASLILDNHVRLFNPNFNEIVSIATTGAAGNKIVFSENSTLEFTANLRPGASAEGTSIEFNGTFIGERNLILRDGVNASFGATADNSAFAGNIVLQDIDIVSDITTENGFLPEGGGLVLQADGTPAEAALTINGANSLAGNINRNGQGGNYTVNFNANQENMGSLRMINDANLTFNIDPSVTALHFNCIPDFEWTPASVLTINGFESGVLRFGEADTCLTAVQLSQINVGGETVFLDENGFLVTEGVNPNNAPTVANALADVTMDEDFGTDMIDISGVFADADGDALTYSAMSSDVGVATVSITGDMLSVVEVGVGTTTIMVTANDGNTGIVTNSFDYTINMVETPNNAPTVANALADVTMEEGFGTDMIDLSDVFTDADDDALTYTATSSDGAVATVSIAGNSVTVTEAGIGTTTITITADDGNGGMATSAFDYTIDMMNAINNLNPIAGLQAMPNPTTNGLVTLTYTETIQNGQVKVYNAIGALVKQTNIRAANSVNLNLADTPSELYFIMIEDVETGQRSVVKVLKK